MKWRRMKLEEFSFTVSHQDKQLALLQRNQTGFNDVTQSSDK